MTQAKNLTDELVDVINATRLSIGVDHPCECHVYEKGDNSGTYWTVGAGVELRAVGPFLEFTLGGGTLAQVMYTAISFVAYPKEASRK